MCPLNPDEHRTQAKLAQSIRIASRRQFPSITLQTLMLIVGALLLCLHVSPCYSSLSRQQFHVRSQRYFARRNRGRSFLSSTSPVSYRSQPRATATDASTDEDFYDRRGYRPWHVDFSPRSPGHYSWTSKIVVVNVFMYISQIFFPSITQRGIKLSGPILQGEQLWRLATPMFLHGGLPHLLTNTYSLQAVGNDVERYFGPGRYIFTYLMSGVVANYVSAIKTPNPSLGASGAVFGIVGAYYVFLNRNAHVFGRQGEAMSGAISRTIMMNVILGSMSPMVDNWSHLGGALGGAACAYVFGPRLMVGETPTGARTIVDKPIMRLPNVLEQMPERVGERMRMMKRRMQVESFQSGTFEESGFNDLALLLPAS